MNRRIPVRLYVALACVAVWLVGVRAAERSPAAMATAADAFLKSLSADQRGQAVFSFDGDERLHWHFIPTEVFRRNGLTIKAMSEPQRQLARKLLEVSLSQRGYQTATSIMDLETILGALEASRRSRLVRDPERYFFSVFGTPSPTGTWAWRVEGHHMSLHFTVVKGALISSAPAFFGTNPAEVRQGPKKGLRILGAAEDSARAMFLALGPNQQRQALINSVAPDDIVTVNHSTISPLTPVGIAAGTLDAKQRELLMKIVDDYVSLMASEIADERMAKLHKAGLDKITFAWAGDVEVGKKHYYRVQGPTFLIEYDNTQDDGNHVHSVWRDFDGDFGRDLLREHLKTVAH